MECGTAVVIQEYSENVVHETKINKSYGSIGQKVDPDSIDFVGRGRSKFEKMSDGEKLAYVKDKKTNLVGIIDADYVIVVPFIFYNHCNDSLQRVAKNTIGEYPELAMEATKECRGWGQVFINRSMDINFDVGSQEKFYKQFSEGKNWVEKYIDVLGKEIFDRCGTSKKLEVQR